jgi:hypothetical protein
VTRSLTEGCRSSLVLQITKSRKARGWVNQPPQTWAQEVGPALGIRVLSVGDIRAFRSRRYAAGCPQNTASAIPQFVVPHRLFAP